LSEVAAASSDATRFESEWVFPAGPPAADPFWTNEDNYIVDIAMEPRTAWTLAENVSAADGTLLLAAGSQLVQMKATMPMLCSWGKGAVGTLSSSRKICLFDPRNTGTYGFAFDIGLDDDRAMVLQRAIPAKRVIAISGAALNSLAPSELKDRPRFVMLLEQVILRRRPGNGVAPFYEVRLQAETRNSTTWTNRYYLCSNNLCNGLNRIGDKVDFAGMSVEIVDLQHEKAQARLIGSFTIDSFRSAVLK
jgi:hypothetical protein